MRGELVEKKKKKHTHYRRNFILFCKQKIKDNDIMIYIYCVLYVVHS